jgi:myo-inositol-1(or 4)-monophosphatase
MKNANLDFATHLAEEAGNVALEAFQKGKAATALKPDRTVVTETDGVVDQILTNAIHKQYPDDVLMSEESQPSYSPSSDTLAPAVWIIDPIDGTTNFSLGLHIWGVLITRLVGGYPDTAALNFPLVNELYTTQKGQGAYLNGRAIHVEPADKERPYSFFACCSRTYRNYLVNIPYKIRILGSSAYTFCAVARGAALLGFDARPKIWDFAGAWLLVQEAGGVIETLDGSQPLPLRTGMDYAHQYFPLLAAASPELLVWARKKIVPR